MKMIFLLFVAFSVIFKTVEMKKMCIKNCDEADKVKMNRTQINRFLGLDIPKQSNVISSDRKRHVIPTWFTQNTELCYEWYADGDSGQCSSTAHGRFCAKPGTMTRYYRDDTDRRTGGCRMRWGIISSQAPSWFNSVQICYRWYADGDGGQCGGGIGRNTCASVNSWTQDYRDDSDRRTGGCRMSWKLYIPSSSETPEWLKRVKLCFYWYPDGDGGQCGGGAGRDLCADANYWTDYYRDDSDRRTGGCEMSWGIKF